MSEKRKSISSDLKRVDKIKEQDINYNDIPALDDSFFMKEMIVLPHKKDSITLRIDHEVLQYFKEQGRGYQTLINAILKTYVQSRQKYKK